MRFYCDQEIAEAVIITLQLAQGILSLRNAESLRANTKQTNIIKEKVVNSMFYKKKNNED